jgi:hypothetical protein
MRSKAKPRKTTKKAKARKVRKKPPRLAKSKRRAKGKRRTSDKRLRRIKKDRKHPKRKKPGTHVPGGSGGNNGGNNGGNDGGNNENDGGNNGDGCLVIVRAGCCRCGVAMGCDGDADGSDANDNDNADNNNAAQEAVKQTRRYLQVKNDTAKALTVYVQYHTLSEDGWKWFPAVPSGSAKVAVFKVPAGQAVHLIHDNFRINADRVRIWTAKQTQYRDTDLWLVPEEDEQGNHWYLADEMDTRTVKFQDNAAE